MTRGKGGGDTRGVRRMNSFTTIPVQRDTNGWGAGARPPASTYRLQLGPGLGFSAATELVPYLQALGAEAVYVSPILQAALGSTHGYDVVDHSRISDGLGRDQGFERFARALAERGMGVIVDFVPNHVGLAPENRWWTDVLENGPSSVYAGYFDIDWDPLKSELRNRVLVPVLGDQYGSVLEKGELALCREGGSFWLQYGDQRFPISPRSVPTVLRHDLDRLRVEMGPEDVAFQELESICAALEKLAPREEVDAEKIAERAREKEVAKRRLAALLSGSHRVEAHVNRNVALFNGSPGEPHSFDRLHELLEAQAYRLAHWRVAGEEVNYRRFFEVSSLAAVRMEAPPVFRATHQLIMDLVRRGLVRGLRIDHPDGLYDPPGYFRRLQAAALAREGAEVPLGAEDLEALEDRLEADLRAGLISRRALYVVAEKVLAAGERMPDGWAVDGTTGYEFLNTVNGLFVDAAAARTFARAYARSGGRATFDEEGYSKRRLVCRSIMSSEIRMLARRLEGACEADRATRDFTLGELTRALVEYVSLLPVYRTYVTPEGQVDTRDRVYIESTIARARRRSPLIDPSVFEFLRDVILQHHPASLSQEARRERLQFALKLQQVTGAVMAKGLEDSAFYSFAPLASLNEVGGDPSRFGTSPNDFHVLNAHTLEKWPGSLLSTSTHDTKRSEDVRLRIDALSEIPEEWWARCRRWSRLHRRFSKVVSGERAPSQREELLFYQTVVGTIPEEVGPGTPGWDAYVGRITAYMEKALREAKVHTSWVQPDTAWESAVREFVTSVLGSQAFLDNLTPFAARVVQAARVSSLAQVALKIASPGVCDVYQGNELWDLSLVDPDNRRPVDFALRRQMLEELDRRMLSDEGRGAVAREVSARDALADGRAKLLLLATGLRLRRVARELFLEGEYLPLEAVGPHAGHLVAFGRHKGGRALVCIAPRLVLTLLESGGGQVAWQGGVPLPATLAGGLRDAVTGEVRSGQVLNLAEAFAAFPVALLISGFPLPLRPS